MASAHFADVRALAETLSREELIQQLVTMEGHKTENKKISDQRDRVVRKMRRQTKEIEDLKQENEILRDLLQNRMPTGCIAETTYQPILDENEKLKEEIEELKADKKKFFDEVVEATQCDADTEDEVVSIITDMESEYDPEMMREIKEKYEDEKMKVAYYDGFLKKMFNEDENGEWTEWTDFVEKKSFEDGKRLFGFEGDSDDE